MTIWLGDPKPSGNAVPCPSPLKLGQPILPLTIRSQIPSKILDVAAIVANEYQRDSCSGGPDNIVYRRSHRMIHARFGITADQREMRSSKSFLGGI